MKKALLTFVVVCGVVGVAAISASWGRSGPSGGAGDFSIYVAPGTIVPDAPCNWVTIHTNVPLRVVENVSAAVNGSGVTVAQVYADARGNVVVKLKFADVLARVKPPAATISLTLVVDGVDLTASETVAARD